MFPTLLALLLAAPATAVAPSPPDFVEPEWTATPSAEELLDHYPVQALEHGQVGRVVLECRAGATGAVKGCKVVSEIPSKAGFAKSTLEVARFYRMRPTGPHGLPLTWRKVRVTVDWTPPGRFLVDSGPYDPAPRNKLIWQGRVRPSEVAGNVETTTLICRITETGRLSPCAEPGQHRPYDGPAKWTLRQFQAGSVDVDGRPTAGRLVVLNVPKSAASKLP